MLQQEAHTDNIPWLIPLLSHTVSTHYTHSAIPSSATFTCLLCLSPGRPPHSTQPCACQVAGKESNSATQTTWIHAATQSRVTCYTLATQTQTTWIHSHVLHVPHYLHKHKPRGRGCNLCKPCDCTNRVAALCHVSHVTCPHSHGDHVVPSYVSSGGQTVSGHISRG